jgi:hypothetical protein
VEQDQHLVLVLAEEVVEQLPQEQDLLVVLAITMLEEQEVPLLLLDHLLHME